MIVVRQVFQAKYGHGDELVAILKELNQLVGERGVAVRILTDQSGPFFTVVSEVEVESLGAWEQLLAQGIADQRFAAGFQRMVAVVESGRREFYRIEA